MAMMRKVRADLRHQDFRREGSKMCLTIPYRVRSVEGDRAIVESQGRVREVDVSRLPAKPGDYVLVQGGVAMMTIDRKEAEAMLEAWDEIGATDA